MEKLKTGDIILTAQLGAVSKAVRIATGSKFSHSIFYVGSGSYIHSDGQGVHANNIQRLLFEKEEYVEVLRIEKTDFISEACVFARSQIGKEYSVKDAMNSKNPLSNKKKINRQFCSRLVSQSFEHSGIDLVENADFCTPKDIQKSLYVKVVPGCVKKATEQEIKFANSFNPLQKQIEITNEILSSIRKLTSNDIQSFEELSLFIIDNPSFDTQITAIVRDSGYLSMWKHEIHQNPWRYNGEVFLSLDIDPVYKKESAKLELKSGLEQAKLYTRNFEMYRNLSRHYSREYFEMNITLYGNLINQMSNRIDSAKYVIKHT